MGICHHSCDSKRHHGPRKFLRIRHRAFHMHMNVHQPGNHKFSGPIKDRLRFPFPAPCSYPLLRIFHKIRNRRNVKKLSSCHCNIHPFEALPESPINPGILYHQIHFHNHNTSVIPVSQSSPIIPLLPLSPLFNFLLSVYPAFLQPRYLSNPFSHQYLRRPPSPTDPLRSQISNAACPSRLFTASPESGCGRCDPPAEVLLQT